MSPGVRSFSSNPRYPDAQSGRDTLYDGFNGFVSAGASNIHALNADRFRALPNHAQAVALQAMHQGSQVTMRCECDLFCGEYELFRAPDVRVTV